MYGNKNDILNNTEAVSSYNKNQWVAHCEICKKEPATDVHHIQFQCNADHHNMIGHIHKDVQSNLVSVCKHCHIEIHRGSIVIDKYVHSSRGIILMFEYVSPTEHTTAKKKFTLEQQEWVRQTKKKMTYKHQRQMFQDKYKTSISSSSLRKIIAGAY